MDNKILVTGIGVISAIGNSVPENLSSLRSAQSGIGPIRYLETVHKNDFMVGELQLSNDDLCEFMEIAAKDKIKHSRTSLMTLAAAREALMDCGLMAENMILAAQSMGIGSVCLGSPARFMTSPVAAEYLARLGFSEGYRLALVIGFGYPDESPAAKPRDETKVKWIE